MEEKTQLILDDEGDITQPEIQEQIIARMKAESALINRVMTELMHDGVHYGKVPGIDKPFLHKPGADMLARLFRFTHEFKTEMKELENGHREYRTEGRLFLNGKYLGNGGGSCSTMESKYRYRKAERLCPMCGEPAVIKGKASYGGGWVCWKKKNGCGASFDDGDKSIEEQVVGKIENPDPADVYNTCEKQSEKRCFTGIILRRTAASDVFCQDSDDKPPLDQDPTEPQPEEKQPENQDDRKPPTLDGLRKSTEEHFDNPLMLYKLQEHWILECKEFNVDKKIIAEGSEHIKLCVGQAEETIITRLSKKLNKTDNPDAFDGAHEYWDSVTEERGLSESTAMKGRNLIDQRESQLKKEKDDDGQIGLDLGNNDNPDSKESEDEPNGESNQS